MGRSIKSVDIIIMSVFSKKGIIGVENPKRVYELFEGPNHILFVNFLIKFNMEKISLIFGYGHMDKNY